MFAKEETHDLYSAIDLAVDKLEHQAQKLKAQAAASHKARRRRARTARAGATSAPQPAPPRLAAHGEVIRSSVSRRSRCRSRRRSSSWRSRDEFLVFTQRATTSALAVLYRRKDGDYGLIAAGPERSRRTA